MWLTKRRLITLGIGLLAALLTIAGLVAATGTAKASTTTSFLVTLYGWPDNSPPGNAIAYPADGGYPTIHNAAGGTGTYSDPVTFATDQAELPIGSIVYYPYLHRYFIMEDDCVACDEDWTGQGPDGGPGFHHIDLWINGQNGNSNAVINCEDSLTQGSSSVIIDPPRRVLDRLAGHDEPRLAIASLTAVRMTDAAAPRAQSSKVWERVMIRHWRAEPKVCWSKLSRIRCSYRS